MAAGSGRVVFETRERRRNIPQVRGVARARDPRTRALVVDCLTPCWRDLPVGEYELQLERLSDHALAPGRLRVGREILLYQQVFEPPPGRGRMAGGLVLLLTGSLVELVGIAAVALAESDLGLRAGLIPVIGGACMITGGVSMLAWTPAPVEGRAWTRRAPIAAPPR